MSKPSAELYTLSIENLGRVNSIIVPEIEVFQHINFNYQLDDRNSDGNEPGWSLRTSFNVSFKNDERDNNISSFIVYSGYWQFYDSVDFQGPFSKIFGPGRYARVSDFEIQNDSIGSFKCISSEKPEPNLA